jgi:glutamyl-tRNA reductase
MQRPNKRQTESAPTAAQELRVLGTNHRQAPLTFRERLTVGPEQQEAFLREAHKLLEQDCFLLSTCNRTELYTLGGVLSPHTSWDVLRRQSAIDPVADAGNFYEYHGRAAVQQLFRVATGIDSQMLGEPQILEQVKEAHKTSLQANTAGVVGERLLASAIRCGKRARSETDISKGAISIAYAAVSLAHKIFSDLAPRTALVLGAGETGALVARNLREHGIGRLLILNRSIDRARAVATPLRGEPLPLSELATQLPHSDIVICATGATQPLIDKDMARNAMKRRHGRSMLIVDIGVPRNVAVDVGQINSLFLNNVDGLQSMIDKSMERRLCEVPRVEAIIEEEVERFLGWHSGLQVGPVIRELQDSLMQLRDQEIERLGGLSSEQQRAAEEVAHRIIQKLLHRPMSLLKEATTQGESGQRRIQAIRDIFGLDDDNDKVADGGDRDDPDGAGGTHRSDR